MDIKKELLEAGFSGDFDESDETLTKFSHDASMFEIRPTIAVAPKNTSDVEILTKLVADNKKDHTNLSLTARSAGTDMSGAAINDSIIVDFQKYFTSIGAITDHDAKVQPGVYFRHFDAALKEANGVLMPTYPASRDLCTVGGMVNNNSGGEKSIEFGNINNFVNELEFVFADGVARKVRPLNREELDRKMSQQDFEGKVYRDMFKLLDDNYDVIKSAEPKVSKNATGYQLWRAWDREKGIFDLNQVIVGGQGTLGLVTDIDLRVVHARADEGLLVIFVKDIEHLGDLVAKVVEYKPSRFESFDDNTLLLSIKFLPKFLKYLGPAKFIKLLFSLIPNLFMLMKGVPQLVLMASIKGDSTAEIDQKLTALQNDLEKERKFYGISSFEKIPTEAKGEKFWVMRRYSFQILRSNVKDKHTAPFIDDFIVNPEHLPEFLPQIRQIIKKYNLFATIAGHMGDGNFHIIPLMNIELESEREKLLPAMEEVNNLVLKYGGSLSAEHNDGLVRGPWLERMYGNEVYQLFKQTKKIFDPQNIFNPRKKADADWDYSYSHIRKNFKD